MSWHWEGVCRVCDECDWLVLSERFYYWCIGCEKIQEKGWPI